LGATQPVEYHGKKKRTGGGVSKKVRPALGAYPLSRILGKFCKMGVASKKVRAARAGIPFFPMPPNSRGKTMLGKIALKKCYQTKIRDQNVAKYFNYFSKFGDFLILERNIFDRIFSSYFDFRTPKNADDHCMTKLEKEKLDAAGHGKQRFVFNSFLFF
jgi:hypothetical protein